MRSLAIATLFLVVIGSAALAENNPISGLDPLLYSESGWQWGTFNEEVSTIEFTNDSIVLDIPPADVDGEYPGLVNGGIGVNFGSDRFGFLDFDHNLYQVEVPLRILDGNDAAQFRIAVGDADGTGGTRDEFYYHVNTFDYDIDEWDTFVRPLTDYDGVYTEGGDGVMNFGNNTVQLMSMWDTAEALNIEIGGIYITEINPTPSNVIFELNSNNFGQAWTWGSFGVDGAIVYTDDSIIINAETQGGAAGAQGGLGHGLLQREFDGEDTELVVTAKLLEDNEAASFLIEMRDNEELDGIISDGVQELDWEAEQYTYEILTDDFNEDEFTELRIPMTDYVSRGQADGANFDGDLEQNFGMYMVHIMSPWGPAETLNIEIESIRIEPIDSGIAGDYDNSGALDVGDLDLQAQVIANGSNDADYDLTDDQLVDVNDRIYWVEELKKTWIGDANLDGEFNSDDLIRLFQGDEYNDGISQNSTWSTGDMTGDLEFNSDDLIFAFQRNGYRAGPRPPAAVSAVPEPSSALLALIGLWGLLGLSRRRPLG